MAQLMIRCCRYLILAVAVAVAVAATAACGKSVQSPPVRAKAPLTVAKVPKHEASHVRRLLTRLVDDGWLAGVAVGVYREQRDGGPFFVSAGRVTDAGPEQVTEDTVFEIGSATKVFTSVLLADMARRGLVTLDDPVSSHLPAHYRVPSRDGKLITLAHLASHTAGLPRLPPGFTVSDPQDPYAAFTEHHLQRALATTALSSRPGELYSYSNYGAGLLGFALATTAKRKFGELLQARILLPLGMNSTAISLSPGMSRRFAQGHDADGRVVRPWHMPVIGGAGALRSSARDMLGFVRANLRLDRSAFAQAMRLTHVPRHPRGNGAGAGHVGLGWHVEPSGARWHSGATGGYRSFVAFDPKSRRAVVVLASTASRIVDQLGRSLLAPSPRSGYALNVPRLATVPAAVLDRYIGAYQLTPLVVLHIARSKTGLTVQLTGQPAFRIYPESERRFFLRVVKARIEFDVDESGAVVRALLTQGGNTQSAARKP